MRRARSWWVRRAVALPAIASLGVVGLLVGPSISPAAADQFNQGNNRPSVAVGTAATGESQSLEFEPLYAGSNFQDLYVTATDIDTTTNPAGAQKSDLATVVVCLTEEHTLNCDTPDPQTAMTLTWTEGAGNPSFSLNDGGHIATIKPAGANDADHSYNSALTATSVEIKFRFNVSPVFTETQTTPQTGWVVRSVVVTDDDVTPLSSSATDTDEASVTATHFSTMTSNRSTVAFGVLVNGQYAVANDHSAGRMLTNGSSDITYRLDGDFTDGTADVNNYAQHFTTRTQSFGYTGSVQNYTVPNGVSKVTVNAWGAGGNGYYAAPGGGARVHADLFVRPGDILHIRVGGTPTGNAGGYNGGGAGGDQAGGGGGASDVRRESDSLSDRLLVAGGGGGGRVDGYGGNGGDPLGKDGYGGSNGSCIFGGGRGGQSDVGGAAGQASGPEAMCGPQNGSGGTLGAGGSGGGLFGGGGGGGYYGGGGGSSLDYQGNGGGGGGGSSYITANAENIGYGPGVSFGAGQVTITADTPEVIVAPAFGYVSYDCTPEPVYSDLLAVRIPSISGPNPTGESSDSSLGAADVETAVTTTGTTEALGADNAIGGTGINADGVDAPGQSCRIWNGGTGQSQGTEFTAQIVTGTTADHDS